MKTIRHFFFFYDRKGYFRIGNDVEEKHNSNFVKRQAIVCSSISHLTFFMYNHFFYNISTNESAFPFIRKIVDDTKGIMTGMSKWR